MAVKAIEFHRIVYINDHDDKHRTRMRFEQSASEFRATDDPKCVIGCEALLSVQLLVDELDLDYDT